MSGAGRNGKPGFCHVSVRKQQVLTGKKTRSYWRKKSPHQPITKLYGKPRDLAAGGQGKLWEGRRQKTDSSSDGDRDSGRDRDLSLRHCLYLNVNGYI